jgi:acyl carrier protein
MDNVETALKKILNEMFGVPLDKITSEALIMDDLHLDSLDMYEVTMEVEDVLELPFTVSTDHKLIQAKTFGELVSITEALRGSRQV